MSKAMAHRSPPPSALENGWAVLAAWYDGLPRSLYGFCEDQGPGPLAAKSVGRALAEVVESSRRYFSFLGPWLPRALAQPSSEDPGSAASRRLALLGYLNVVRCSRIAYAVDAIEAERQWLPWLATAVEALDAEGRRTLALAFAAHPALQATAPVAGAGELAKGSRPGLPSSTATAARTAAGRSCSSHSRACSSAGR
ncbi:MAG: hypothetical protein QM765_16295 [Myxococcales bacterium]